MLDAFKDAGLEYADKLPLGLGIALGPLILAAWVWFLVDQVEQDARRIIRAIVLFFGVIAAFQVPGAYLAAKDYCETEWEQAGGSILSTTPPTQYMATKCHNAWPLGP